MLFILTTGLKPFETATPTDIGFRSFVLATQPQAAALPLSGGVRSASDGIADSVAAAHLQPAQRWIWPARMSSALRSLVLACLQVDPKERMTMEQVCKHVWFTPKAGNYLAEQSSETAVGVLAMQSTPAAAPLPPMDLSAQGGSQVQQGPATLPSSSPLQGFVWHLAAPAGAGQQAGTAPIRLPMAAATPSTEQQSEQSDASQSPITNSRLPRAVQQSARDAGQLPPLRTSRPPSTTPASPQPVSKELQSLWQGNALAINTQLRGVGARLTGREGGVDGTPMAAENIAPSPTSNARAVSIARQAPPMGKLPPLSTPSAPSDLAPAAAAGGSGSGVDPPARSQVASWSSYHQQHSSSMTSVSSYLQADDGTVSLGPPINSGAARTEHDSMPPSALAVSL